MNQQMAKALNDVANELEAQGHKSSAKYGELAERARRGAPVEEIQAEARRQYVEDRATLGVLKERLRDISQGRY
ncbi:hypothetical protein [Nonomuraea sp. KM88]|uniref:hypothetical protein n=1 Tax=Nonomuraea sp. KM88 TaxID=3457427 RepID=UPI003FCCD6E8